jgi:hypothetical protein
LEESIQQVPKSVAKLSPLADAVHVIANQPNQPLELISSIVQLPMKDGMTEPCNGSRTSAKVKIAWDDFARSWYDDATTSDTSHETVITQGHVPAATGTNEVSTDPTTSDKDQNYTKQQLHPMKLQRRISMSSSFDNSESHKVANDIWKNSYPNFCARCAIATDIQCGVCIHNKHICACTLCHGNLSSNHVHNSCSQQHH